MSPLSVTEASLLAIAILLAIIAVLVAIIAIFVVRRSNPPITHTNYFSEMDLRSKDIP